MKEFDKKINQHKKQHLKLIIFGGTMLLLATVVLVFWLFIAKAYNINVKPESARASVTFTIDEGVGIFVAGKLYTLTSMTKFTTVANHYLPHSELITPNREQTINIVLKPKPSKIIATTQPAGEETAWYLDNQLVYVGDKLNIEVKPGLHDFEIDSPYHQVKNETVEINIDEEKILQLTLVPISGQIRFASKPEGATILLDGVSIGNTPVSINRFGGEYKVRIELDGYEPTLDTIAITNKKQNAERNYFLEPEKANLTFLLKPEQGDLLVDGKSLTDKSQVSVTANRQHSILYQKPGYYAYKKDIKLLPGVEKNLTIVLKPELGKVVINSTPKAEVIANGQSLGMTPISKNFPAILYRLQFIKAGYRTVVKRIKPQGNTATVVNAVLLTEFEARRKQGKPTVAKKLGIEMLKFRPQKVTMGSKANEKGRRRNEFIKKVEFSRPILVSRDEITEAIFSQFRKGTASSPLPVSDIAWIEAVQFCNWLSLQEGLPLFYRIQNGRYIGVNPQSKGYRLPTEAEWEWLARRASRVEETIYVWGNFDKIPEKAGNLADQSVKGKNTFYFKKYNDGFVGKAAVGSFKADRIGLNDLAGNVSEWVHDSYSNDPPEANQVVRDPVDMSLGSRHFSKGANYNTGRLSELRAAYREPSSGKDATIGFRIVRYE